MSLARLETRLAALDDVLKALNRLRRPRPEKVDWLGRPAKRRRVGDVMRWKENNRTLDAVEIKVRALMKKKLG